MKSSGLSISRLMFFEEKMFHSIIEDFSYSHLNKSLINPKETKLFHYAVFFFTFFGRGIACCFISLFARFYFRITFLIFYPIFIYLWK